VTDYPLARRPADTDRLDLESFARAASLHPDLVRRFVALGLLESTVDPLGRLTFPPRQVAVVARVQRLRAGLSLNYAALGLVLDLLDRVTELEAALRRNPAVDRATAGGRTWTPRS
jgi:pimeloyl-ACP methyl ester carboxylesterase